MNHTTIKTMSTTFDISSRKVMPIAAPGMKHVPNGELNAQPLTAVSTLQENGRISTVLRGQVVKADGTPNKRFTYSVAFYGYTGIEADLSHEFESRIKTNSEIERDER